MIPIDMRDYGSGIVNKPTQPTQSKASGHPVVDIGDKDYPVNKETLDVDHNQLNRDLAKKQLEYVNAESRGDEQAMQRAANAGAELRRSGATIEISPEARALQTYYQRPEIKQAIQTRSTDDLNKAILQAKNDYIWAKNNNDPAGMKAASQAAVHLRSLGGTIPLNASFEEAKNIVYSRPQPSGHPVVDYGGTTLPVDKQTLDIDVDLLNREVEKRKIEYINAQIRGDQTAMQRAAQEAADLRKAGATLTSDQDTAVTKAMKQYYEQPSIKKALASSTQADLNQACYEADTYFMRASVSGNKADMEAAAELFINLRAMGANETHGSGGGQPLTETEKMIIGTVLRLAPVVGQGISLTEFITAQDLFNGQKLSEVQRGLALAGGIPGGGGLKIGGGISSKLDDILVKMSNGEKVNDASTTGRTYSDLKNQASQVSTNAEKGELAEAIADVVMKRAGYEKLPAKVGSNNGFDGVYVKYDKAGEVEDITVMLDEQKVADLIINESKFGNSQLKKTKGGHLQMSETWINMNLKKMLDSADPEVVKTAQLLDDNYHLIRTKLNRMTADGKNKWSSNPGDFGK